MELQMLAREYSCFRSSNPKWMHAQQVTTTPGVERVHVYESAGMAVIYRAGTRTLESYALATLQKRTVLKRAPQYFRAVWQLWQELNPRNLPGLSKDTCSKVFSCFYTELKDFDVDLDLLHNCLRHDLALDFHQQNWLSFTDFYDVFFQYIDSNTRSTLESEYVRTVKRLHAALQNSEQQRTLQLYSQRHLPRSARPQLAPWMRQLLEKQAKQPRRRRGSVRRASADGEV